MLFDLKKIEHLTAPKEYWEATTNELEEVCNGCGLAGWKGLLVPDTVYALRISESCDIHDWMYYFGVDEEDKELADDTFYYNMKNTVLESTTFWPLKKLRLWRIKKYYSAVKHAGSKAFWADKIFGDQ